MILIFMLSIVSGSEEFSSIWNIENLPKILDLSNPDTYFNSTLNAKEHKRQIEFMNETSIRDVISLLTREISKHQIFENESDDQISEFPDIKTEISEISTGTNKGGSETTCSDILRKKSEKIKVINSETAIAPAMDQIGAEINQHSLEARRARLSETEKKRLVHSNTFVNRYQVPSYMGSTAWQGKANRQHIHGQHSMSQDGTEVVDAFLSHDPKCRQQFQRTRYRQLPMSPDIIPAIPAMRVPIVCSDIRQPCLRAHRNRQSLARLHVDQSQLEFLKPEKEHTRSKKESSNGETALRRENPESASKSAVGNQEISFYPAVQAISAMPAGQQLSQPESEPEPARYHNDPFNNHKSRTKREIEENEEKPDRQGQQHSRPGSAAEPARYHNDPFNNHESQTKKQIEENETQDRQGMQQRHRQFHRQRLRQPNRIPIDLAGPAEQSVKRTNFNDNEEPSYIVPFEIKPFIKEEADQEIDYNEELDSEKEEKKSQDNVEQYSKNTERQEIPKDYIDTREETKDASADGVQATPSKADGVQGTPSKADAGESPSSGTDSGGTASSKENAGSEKKDDTNTQTRQQGKCHPRKTRNATNEKNETKYEKQGTVSSFIRSIITNPFFWLITVPIFLVLLLLLLIILVIFRLRGPLCAKLICNPPMTEANKAACGGSRRKYKIILLKYI